MFTVLPSCLVEYLKDLIKEKVKRGEEGRGTGGEGERGRGGEREYVISEYSCELMFIP